MPALTSDNIGQYVSFAVHPSSILGTNFDNVKVLAILDAATAKLFLDIDSMHANVYPTLPDGQGTPDDPYQYQYAKIERAGGQVEVLGLPWIDESSVTVEQQTSVVITIDGVSPAERDTIREALSANGFTAVKIETI